MRFFLLLFLVAVSFQLNSAADPITKGVGIIGSGLVAEDIVEDLDDALASRIAQTEAAGEYLAAKSFRELRMLLNGADQVLESNIKLTFEELSEQQQQFLKTVETLINETEKLRKDVLALEDFVAIDIAVLLNSLPFIENNEFPLRAVEGYSQVFNPGGVYEMTFRGRVFSAVNDVTLTVFTINDAGEEQILQSVQPGPFAKEYEATFELSSNAISTRFPEREASKLMYRIDVTNTKKRSFLEQLFGAKKPEPKHVFDFESSILLLPKTPVTYELVYVHAGEGWSEEVFSASDTALAPRTGVSEKWNYNNLVCVSIPDDALMIKDTATAYVAAGIGAGTWGHWNGDYQYLDENGDGPTKVCRNFAHQIHDQDRTLAIKVNYRKPVTTYGRVPLEFKDPIDEEVSRESLSFNELYVARFEEDPITYYLRFKFFNGKRFTLEKGLGDIDGISTNYASKQGYNTLSVQLSDPYRD